MAIMGLNTEATVRYVSDLDPCKKKDGTWKPGATVWVIGTLDSYTEGRIKDQLTNYDISEDKDEPTVRINIHDAAIEACRFGIKGWEKFQDDKGNEIKFETTTTFIKGRKYQVVKDSTLAQIPSEILMELYRVIKDKNSVSEDETKNSEEG